MFLLRSFSSRILIPSFTNKHLLLPPLPPMVRATAPLFALYNLNNANNIYHVDEWKIYKDFYRLIASGTCKEVQEFHNTYIKNYHDYLRSQSQSPVRLEFKDDAWGANTILDYPVYDRIMNRIARRAITDAPDTPALRDTLSWMFGLCVVDPKQMMYALNTLIITKKTPLATWLIEQGIIEFREVQHVHPLRQAICCENYELAQLIYARYRYIPSAERELIRHDLAGTGFYAWRSARPDMSSPLFVWLKSLPEFKGVI